MDLENLRLFVDVARRGNFAAVARDRDVDPSSVSRAMALLEKELGIRLLHRSTRHVTLTEAGAIYLARVDALLDELDRALDAARGEGADPGGTLRLTASVAFGNTCLIPLVPAFRARYPLVKLELLFTDSVLDLVSERIDLAVRLAQPSGPDSVASKLFSTRYRVCASPAYLEAHAAPPTPAALRQHNCLLFALPEFRNRWFFQDAAGNVEEVPVTGDVMILSALALRDCARQGLGPVLLADWLIRDDIASGALVDLFPAYHVTATAFDTAVWLLYPTRSHLPGKVRVMIEFLRKHLGQARG
jgi:DNA-binding transcriptional LysR family regulator